MNRVWYASYGSNLSYQSRFMCYITGGQPPGSRARNPGSRDKTPPSDHRPVSLPYELYFAGYSSAWRGAPAFLRREQAQAITYGRMYLVTDDQFNDIVLQENGRAADGTRFVPTFETLIEQRSITLPGNPLYGCLVRVGSEDEYPILTFTTTRNLPIDAPSEAYVKIIASG